MNLRGQVPQDEARPNLTPMIDVVFLMVVFFMVITDLTQREDPQLVLPAATAATELEEGEIRARVDVLQDGTYRVKKLEFGEDELEVYLDDHRRVLGRRYGARAGSPYIRADGNAPFTAVQAIVLLAARLGFEQTDFAVELQNADE